MEFPLPSNQSDAPERIYGWRDSQLSIARHYGGCRFNGHQYIIVMTEEGEPLVRQDVLKRERKERAAKAYEEATS